MGRNSRRKAKQRSAGEPPPAASTPGSAMPRALLAGAVTALFVLRPLYPSEAVAIEGDGLPVVMLWLVVLAAWAFLVARGAIDRVQFGWPDAAMSLLVLWHSAAALWAVAHESPRPAINMLWEWLAMGVAFFLARQVFLSGRQRRAAGAVMIALAVVVSANGIYQYAIELPATRARYEREPDVMLREVGLWYPPGSPERDAFEERLRSLEPGSTFALTNSLAGFLVPWSLVAMAAAAVYAGRLDRKWRIALAALLIPLGLCLLLTKSRGAYLAGAGGTCAVAMLWWSAQSSPAARRRGILLVSLTLVLAAAAVVGVIAVGGLDAEVFSEAPKSLGYRAQYWHSSWQMIQDAPLVGCGPGNFQHRYTAYKLPEASEEIADPHNLFFEIWATAGTPALLALVGFLVALIVCVWRSRQAANEQSAPHGDGKSQPNEQPADAWIILAAAPAGVLLAAPLGAISAAPPGWVVSLMAVPLGAVVLLVLWPWIKRGRDSAVLWTLAVATLLIHLLFAGGIGYPGVAASLWLASALALGACRCGEHCVSAGLGMAALVAAMGLLAACYLTGYQPTLTVRTHVERAFADAGDPEELLHQAIEADPWAFKPRKHLGELLHRRWTDGQGDNQTLTAFDEAVRQTLARAPRSASVRNAFAQCYLQQFALSRDPRRLARGIELLESAVALYPNNCRPRADLAEAHLLAGNQSKYDRQRREALRLDELTPHRDKKLPSEQRERLQRREESAKLRAGSTD